MNVHDTSAFVLSTRDYGESDRLITFYTQEGGKLKGIAKGARRSQKRFVHAFEPCSLVALTYRERKSLIWVEACKLVEPHLELRTDVERWGYGALVSEIVMEMTPEGECQPEVFSLFDATLGQLAGTKDPLNVILLFLIRFLDAMGYLPALENCCVCLRPIREDTRWWWHLQQGKLACSEHRSLQDGQLKLDLGTLVLIQQARRLALDKVWRLRLLQERKTPILHGVLDWIRDITRRELKSLRMLEQVCTEAGREGHIFGMDRTV
ncbi:MAG: DNA repair protein RecO [Syntrophobacteraceae bacterium]